MITVIPFQGVPPGVSQPYYILLLRRAVFKVSFYKFIVNDIRNFVFGLAGATVYGFCKSRKQKFVMSFTIAVYGKKQN